MNQIELLIRKSEVNKIMKLNMVTRNDPPWVVSRNLNYFFFLSTGALVENFSPIFISAGVHFAFISQK
jgi:hypothetical protein